MKTRLRFVLVVCSMLLSFSNVFGYTYDWTGGGAGANASLWSSYKNWTGGAFHGVPGPGDVANIGVVAFVGNQPIVDVSTTCTTLNIGNATAVTLTIANPLVVTGATTISSGSNVNSTATFNTGSLTITGSTFALGAALNVTSGDLTFSSGTTMLNNTAAVAVTGNMLISAGTVTLGAATSVSATLAMTTGTFNLNNSLTVAGASTIGSGSTITTASGSVLSALSMNVTASTFTLGSNMLVTGGALTFAGGTTLVNTTTNTIGVTGGMVISAGTVTLGAPTTVSTTLNMTTGTLNLNKPLTVSGAATIGSGSVVTTAASSVLSVQSAAITGSTFTLGSNMLVTGGALTFAGGTTLVNTTTNTIGVTGGMVISAGTVSLGAPTTVSTTLNMTTGTFNLNKPLTVSGAATIGSGSVVTTAASSVLSVQSMAITGSTFTLGSNMLVTGGALTFSNGTTVINNTTNTIGVTGTMSIAAGTVTLGAPTTVSSTFGMTTDVANVLNLNTSLTVTGTSSIGSLSVVNLTSSTAQVTASSGVVTLLSDANGSATIGPIASGSPGFLCTVNVQRFMTGGVGHRGFYLMSSPVYAAVVNSNNVCDLHYLAGGMYLTGKTGFDQAGNPSLYLYREDRAPSNVTFISGNFWGISKFNNTNPYDYNLNQTATTYNIPAGNGFMVFFRGSRNAGFTAAQETQTTFISAPTVTLSASGTLNSGQITYHAWFRPALATLAWSNATSNSAIRGFNLIGNPYASTIDWESFNTTTSTSGIYASNTNVGNTVYEYNPVTHVYDTYQKGGASSGNATRYIVSGQGFFIQTSVDSTAQLIFNESAKVTNQNVNANLFMSTRASMAQLTNAAPEQHLRLQMVKDSVNADNIYIGFNSAASSKYVFNEDAPYKVGTSVVTLASLSSDNVLLTINKVPLPTLIADVIPLNVTANASGTYRLKMSDVQTMSAIYEIWLKDAYTKDSLDMRQNPSYTFDVNVSDPASFGSGRFSLVIRENPALGVHLLDFTARKVATGSQLNWTTENEKNYTGFTIERSADGSAFSALGSFNSSGQGTYGFVDMNPLLGVNLYRLKLVDLNGTVTYSKVVSVTYNRLKAADSPIRVYPNPVKNVLNLFVTADASSSRQADLSAGITSLYKEQPEKVGEYSITIVNNSGTVLKRDVSNQTAWQTDVSNFMPGSYIIQVVSKNGKGVTGQCVFIKL